MKTAKVAEYRSQLASFHKKVLNNHDPLRISGHEGDIVVIPAEDYENLLENIYILRDKITLKSISSIRKSVKNNKFKGFLIDEAFEDIVVNKNK